MRLLRNNVEDKRRSRKLRLHEANIKNIIIYNNVGIEKFWHYILYFYYTFE